MANEKLITLNTLKDFRQKYDKRLEEGQLVPSKALVTKELENVSSESGDTQETPFILQGTGTANGTSSVDTGTVGKNIRKEGSVYCVNQLCDDNLSQVTNNGYTGSITNGVISITKNESGNFGNIIQLSTKLVNGHKYLFTSTAPNYSKIILSTQGSNPTVFYANSITDMNSIPNYNCWIRISGETSDIDWAVGTTITFRVQLIDLTQWFNNSVPTSLTANNFSLYHNYGDYIPYNTSTLVSGNGMYLVCCGRNIYNPNATYNQVIPNKTYFASKTTTITYYDKDKNSIDTTSVSAGTTFTTPNNCHYINSSASNITISLYYSGEAYFDSNNVPLEFDYEAPKVYDTGTETLLSTGVALNNSGERTDIYDYKEPNGTIMRRVGTYTFTGNEEWVSYGSGYRTYCLTTKPYLNIGYSTIPINVIHDTTKTLTSRENCENNVSGSLSINENSIFASADVYQTLTGKTIYYELAASTTEQGTPYSENIEINDFGTMCWYSAYTDSNTNTFVNVPQGCRIFYPAWYVGFIDTLGNREDIDWDANQIAAKGSLVSGDPTTLKGVLNYIDIRIPTPPTSDGTYILTCTIVDGTPTYTWES